MCEHSEQLDRIERKLGEVLEFHELLRAIAMPLLASRGNKMLNAYLRAKGLQL